MTKYTHYSVSFQLVLPLHSFRMSKREEFNLVTTQLTENRTQIVEFVKKTISIFLPSCGSSMFACRVSAILLTSTCKLVSSIVVV